MAINDADESRQIDEKPAEIKQPDNLSPPISEELELNAFAGEALVATMGFHYQVDTMGSRAITTK